MARSIYDNPYYKQQSYYQQPKPGLYGANRYGLGYDKPEGVTGGAEQSEQTSSFMGGGEQQGGGWMNTANQIGAGMAAGAGEDNEEGRFSIDPNAGYKGSFKGLMSGGVAGAIAGGITAQATSFGRVNRNLKNLDTSVDVSGSDAYGAPVYNSGAVSQAYNTMGELEQGRKKINRSVDPATRVFSGLYGTKKKLRKANSSVQQSLLAGQKSFNENNLNYQRQLLAKQQYEDLLNRNVYNVPMGYY